LFYDQQKFFNALGTITSTTFYQWVPVVKSYTQTDKATDGQPTKKATEKTLKQTYKQTKNKQNKTEAKKLNTSP